VPRTPSSATGVAAALHDARVAHRVVVEPDCQTAADQARATGVPPGAVAKTVVTTDHGRLWLAVIPASRRLVLERLRDATGASRHLRLASEDEIRDAFPHFEVGATPPLGRMIGVGMVLDPLVLEHAEVLTAGGDHRHGIMLDPEDLARVTGARVADICTHGGRRFSEHPLAGGGS
jgi:prolyl-tRNA editing enzyme YbaK/EbsC (Cys-tRNA(Pro) deacylase)